MLHTWLISHLSTTRFKCSFPLLFALWAMISWFNTQLMLSCGRARLVHSIFFISPCAKLHYRAFFISHSIWRISIKLSGVHHTAVCVCAVCGGKWICVNMRVFRLLLTHLIHHVFASNLWAYRCRRCYFFIVCATLLMCIRSISCG